MDREKELICERMFYEQAIKNAKAAYDNDVKIARLNIERIDEKLKLVRGFKNG